MIVDSSNNLEIHGNQVSGESFRMECSTRTTNTLSNATFFRSTHNENVWTRVGYTEFNPDQTPSCREPMNIVTNYTVSCNSDGSMFILTISANNTTEHRTYWRCQTNTDNRVLENNVIHLFIIGKSF